MSRAAQADIDPKNPRFQQPRVLLVALKSWEHVPARTRGEWGTYFGCVSVTETSGAQTHHRPWVELVPPSNEAWGRPFRPGSGTRVDGPALLRREEEPLSRDSILRGEDQSAGDIGEAATVPASLVSSEAPLPPASKFSRMTDVASRNEVMAALFDCSVPEPRMGRYVVRGTLGTGGMGTVLDAIDPELDRRVALKVLHRELDERHTTRLRREAQALAKLSHPNVVQVYEVGSVDGQTFVAMEMVKGQTLRDWMCRDPRPGWRECVEVYLQVGEGLVAAHEQGLVHRDFKPANAIIDAKGRVRVLDFGLARRVDEFTQEPDSIQWKPGKTDPEPVLDLSLTRTGAVLGTPAYMPPEQMRGGDADWRSDQFSFCVSLFEAVYGERPFEGATLAALMMSMMHGEVQRPHRGGAPRRLRGIIVRGLAAEPDQRWSSMEVLLDELRRLVAPRWGARAVMGLLGVMIVGGGVGLSSIVGMEDEAPAAVASLPVEVGGSVPAESKNEGGQDARGSSVASRDVGDEALRTTIEEPAPEDETLRPSVVSPDTSEDPAYEMTGEIPARDEHAAEVLSGDVGSKPKLSKRRAPEKRLESSIKMYCPNVSGSVRIEGWLGLDGRFARVEKVEGVMPGDKSCVSRRAKKVRFEQGKRKRKVLKLRVR